MNRVALLGLALLGGAVGCARTNEVATSDGGHDSVAAVDAVALGCGDGVVTGDEECDDGNRQDGDGCTNRCQWARCGDGIVRAGVEDCDDGSIGCAACQRCEGGPTVFSWQGNGHCYERVVAEHGTAADAQRGCWSRGGYLLTLGSEAEWDAVSRDLWGDGSERSWVGLTRLVDDQDVWRWQTGEPVRYARWQSGEPNNYNQQEDCVEIVGRDGWWNDAHCDDRRRSYICEREPWLVDPEGNHAYRVSYEAAPADWAAARDFCAALGGHLATITSSREQAFLEAHVHVPVWIGAVDTADGRGVSWLTGEQWG
jgi:cysteine-rich repeat protein